MERGILFSAPMVRALLHGSKTQTRRPVKRVALEWLDGSGFTPEFVADPANQLCPYGVPGDRLWVRETWARTSVFPGVEMVVFREGDNRTDYGGPWKPGIHLFRRDARINLEVTGVRVERLQAISEADALAEGIVPCYGGFGLPAGEHYHAVDPRESYWSLWEAINGPGSVEANPWIWAVSFKRVESGGAAHKGGG